jgi:hypothetical protein
MGRDQAMRSLQFSDRLPKIAVRVRRFPCFPRREIPAKYLSGIDKIDKFWRSTERFPCRREFASA